MARTRRRPGAQPGNTNARKHGFYSAAVTDAMRNALRRAKNVQPTDLAQEISLARARIFEMLRLEPENHDVLLKTLDVLRKMVAAHYEMSHEEERDFGGALRELVAELMPGRDL